MLMLPPKLPPRNTSCPSSEPYFHTDTLPALGSGWAQFCLFFCFEIGSNYAAQASLELGAIVLPQPPECWSSQAA